MFVRPKTASHLQSKMIVCKICGIAWSQRRFAAHEMSCQGGIEGFKPIQIKKRYHYQCLTCGACIRKEQTARHLQTCSLGTVNSKACSQKEKENEVTAAKLSNSEQKVACKSSECSANQGQELDQQNNRSYFFEKEVNAKKELLTLCKRGGQPMEIDLEELQGEQQLQPPRFPTLQEQNLEAMRAQTANLCSTQLQFKLPCLHGFRKNRLQNQPGLPLVIELFTLSCLLRVVGQYTRQNRWQQGKKIVKRQQFWIFFKEVQPWIANNPGFMSIAKQKVEVYEYDEEYFYINNFEQLYLRLKELIEHYTVRPEKIEFLFSRPIQPRQQKTTRIRRCDPETSKARARISRYFSRRRRQLEMNLHKRTHGPRERTRLKYQALQYQVEMADEIYEMKQVFRKKPSRTHRKEIGEKRQKMIENFCIRIIADDITASVILGEFKVWSRSLQSIDPDQRYLYTDKIPNIPHFQIWYPVPLSALQERKWYFPFIYSQCQGHFQSAIPHETEQSLFRKVVGWYARKGLLIKHSLWQVEQYDEFKAYLDPSYRIKQDEKRTHKKAVAVDINPRLIFPEDVEQEDSVSESDPGSQVVVFDERVPYRGDKQKWSIIHKSENKTIFTCCSVCQKDLIFPAPCCKECLALYHYECRKQLKDQCRCSFQTSQQYQQKMMKEAIAEASKSAKMADLKIKLPNQASEMEVLFQDQNMELNLPALTSASMWCVAGSIKFEKSNGIFFLKQKTMNIIEQFASKKYVYPVIIKEVAGKGRGLVASRDIKENEILANYSGRLITQAETTADYPHSAYIFKFQDGKTPFTTWNIVTERVAGIGMFINHSNDPNAVPGRYWTPKGPLILFFAKRKIKRNEEICFDYGVNYSGSEKFI